MVISVSKGFSLRMFDNGNKSQVQLVEMLMEILFDVENVPRVTTAQRTFTQPS